MCLDTVYSVSRKYSDPFTFFHKSSGFEDFLPFFTADPKVLSGWMGTVGG